MKGLYIVFRNFHFEGENILDWISAMIPNPLYIKFSYLRKNNISALDFINGITKIDKRETNTIKSVSAWEIIISKKPLLEIKQIYPT